MKEEILDFAFKEAEKAKIKKESIIKIVTIDSIRNAYDTHLPIRETLYNQREMNVCLLKRLRLVYNANNGSNVPVIVLYYQ